MKTITKHFKLYGLLLSFTLKSKMSYRFNFLIQTFYGPAYIGVLYLLMRVVFLQTKTLFGWHEAELTLVFLVFNFLYSASIFVYRIGFLELMEIGVNHGRIDGILTKPINAQFLISFQRPEIQQFPMMIGLFLLTLRQISVLGKADILTLLIFGCYAFLGWLIIYYSTSIYATMSFHVTKATQFIEMYHKISDFSHYPLETFPQPLSLVFISLYPVYFAAFIPSLIILDRAQMLDFLSPLLVLGILFILNHFAWRIGLKAYSSASS